MSREHKVKIEKFKRPTTLKFLARIDKVLNLAAISREIESYNHKQTLVSQVNRQTNMTETVERKAQSEELGELFDEVWYILGVALSKFPRDPHKKFKYFYLDEAEQLKDSLSKIEEFDNNA